MMLSWFALIGYCLIALLILLLMLLPLGQTQLVPTPPLGKWQVEGQDGAVYRTPKNDGINCLYIQLRLLGYTGHYKTFSEQVPDEPQSLVTLANFGRKLGFRLVAVKMNVSELAKAGVPAIVHFEEHGIGRGRFHLFLGMSKAENTVGLINGTFIERERMPRDQFRRNWTGFALIIRPTTDWGLWIRRCAVFLTVCGVAVWWALRDGKCCRYLVYRNTPVAPNEN